MLTLSSTLTSTPPKPANSGLVVNPLPPIPFTAAMLTAFAIKGTGGGGSKSKIPTPTMARSAPQASAGDTSQGEPPLEENVVVATSSRIGAKASILP
ncbi:hypothetical protein TrLO_g4246 [Triparma laevis f. longispina]|uniref:Uncharacterized protein n=1 Tax=Triparma laevis f. longispina TaxID=1714387 RepID=A0A9W6Z9E7_9STRA|nr:hypothetical protein TrLO_g4246 [Triparma laevis f. longispina]